MSNHGTERIQADGGKRPLTIVRLLKSRTPSCASPLAASILIVLSMAIASGCSGGSPLSGQRLGTIAKGWCMTIRASQVMPVYPLSEDVKVGDLYIVDTPTEDEPQNYETSGYLSLGIHADRLQLSSATATRPSEPEQHSNSTASTRNWWDDAPRAAFPSYSFEIDHGSSFELGLPVRGIDLGLNLLGTDNAKGTVTMADAYTLGDGEAVLNKQAHGWARNNQAYLRGYQPRFSSPLVISPFPFPNKGYDMSFHYLRVISRVYYIRQFDVSISDLTQRRLGFEASVSERLQNQQDLLARMNAQLNATTQPSATTQPDSAVASGSLLFTSVTSHSVNMKETFAHPLAIGYIAFDIPIGPDGRLGDEPVSTQPRLLELSGGFDRSTVGQWAKMDPKSSEKLKHWIGPEGSPHYLLLQQFKFPTNPDKLRQTLIDNQTPIWLYTIPIVTGAAFLSEALTSATPVEVMIKGELVQWPGGVIPFDDQLPAP